MGMSFFSPTRRKGTELINLKVCPASNFCLPSILFLSSQTAECRKGDSQIRRDVPQLDALAHFGKL